MLQGAYTDYYIPVVLKAHSGECQNIQISLEINNKLKVSLQIFIFCTLGTNGLKFGPMIHQIRT